MKETVTQDEAFAEVNKKADGVSTATLAETVGNEDKFEELFKHVGKLGEYWLREKILNLCGYEIWPPTHGDPRIKGPQPRIITRKQAEAIRKMAKDQESED